MRFLLFLIVFVLSGCGANSKKIVILPFVERGETGHENVAELIKKDFDAFGGFATLKTTNEEKLSPLNNRSTLEELKEKDYKYILFGVSHVETDEVFVRYSLYDLEASKMLRSVRFNGPVKSQKDVAHSISEDAIYYIQGDRSNALTRIIYAIEDDDKYELYFADSDGGRPHMIAHKSQFMNSPSWSSDLKKVAYYSHEDGVLGLYIQHLSTGKRVRVTGHNYNTQGLSWSPRKQQIAFTKEVDGNLDIYLLDLDKQITERLTTGTAQEQSPAWSENGDFILFASNRTGSWQIFKQLLSGGPAEQITHQGLGNLNPKVLDDRSFIYKHRQGDKFFLALQLFDRKEIELLSELDEDSVFSVSPNRRQVMFSRFDSDRKRLFRLDLSSKVSSEVAVKGNVAGITWSRPVN